MKVYIAKNYTKFLVKFLPGFELLIFVTNGRTDERTINGGQRLRASKLDPVLTSRAKERGACARNMWIALLHNMWIAGLRCTNRKIAIQKTAVKREPIHCFPNILVVSDEMLSGHHTLMMIRFLTPIRVIIR